MKHMIKWKDIPFQLLLLSRCARMTNAIVGDRVFKQNRFLQPKRRGN